MTQPINQPTNQHTLFVCTLCRSAEPDPEQTGLSGGQRLFDRLHETIAASDCHGSIRLHPVRCMGSCSRSCVMAFAAPNKLTFILSDLSPVRSVPELLQFSQQYIAHANGHVPYKERPALIKSNLLVVLPPLPSHSQLPTLETAV